MRVLFAFLLLLLTSCYQQERNCADFKTGTFSFEYIIDGKTYVSNFERNDSLEIAYTEQGADSSTVRWLNECEWILQKVHPKSRTDAKAVHLKILSTTKNSYIFEYSLVGDLANKQRGTAVKIK